MSTADPGVEQTADAAPRRPLPVRWGRAIAARSRQVPLRVRLVLLTCALVTGALISTGFAATDLLRNSLMNRVDSQLISASHQLTDEVPRRLGGSRGPTAPGAGATVPAIPAVGGQADGDAPGGSAPVSCAATNTTDSTTDTRPRLPSPYYFQTSDNAGNPTGFSSIPLDQTDCGPAVPSLDIAAVKARLGKPFTVPSRNGGGRWRVVVSVTANGNGSVAVATPLNGVDSTLNQLVEFDVIIGAAVLIVLAGLSYIAVRRSLRPLVDVEHTAAAIAAGDLSRRVPQSDPRTEVGKLAGALNGMLSQIESAFRAREASEQEARTSEHRMRRFITDASHELRTPLTSIRGFAELYRMGAVPEESDVDRVMSRIENESTRMGLLVDDLLLLARLDQQRPLERELVDLETIAADAVHDAQAVSPGRDVQLQLSTDEPVLVVGDDARLRQVVGNLVTNALTHTPQSASVTVGLSIDDTKPERFAVLEVADSGPGLSPKDAQRVFERFYRVEESRTRANGGSGLGLSIVAALTAAHGGTADVETKLGIGSRFRIRLPLADTAV
ncbi:MAG TPA: HAMP domain-containing sensor histidine kinase [Acidothermaceae bacterium]